MANKYQWNKEELIREKEHLLQMRKSGTENRTIYDDMLSIIEPAEKSIGENTNFHYTIEETLKDYQKKNYNKQELMSLYEIAYEGLRLPVFTQLKNEEISLSDRSLISLAKRFFRELDTEYYTKLLKVLKRKNAIHLMPDRDDMKSSGICFYNIFLDKTYVMVARDNTINDIYNSFHEFWHSNEYYLNRGMDHSDNHIFFEELGSLYSAFATNDFLLKEGVNKNLITATNKNQFNTMRHNLFRFMATYTTMEFLEKNNDNIKDIGLIEIKKHLASQGFIIENPEEYVTANILEDIKYSTAYMVANTVYQNFDKGMQIKIIKEVNLIPSNPLAILKNNQVPIKPEVHIKNLKYFAKSLQ